MNVEIVDFPQTVRPAYLAGRKCHGKEEIIPKSEEEMIRWLETYILPTGHWSIMEFLDFTFDIQGISRACSHQLVRHRLASYAQISQRHVPCTEVVIPDSIRDNPRALRLFNEIQQAIHVATDVMIDEGIPQEDARYLYTNACVTSIFFKVNVRQLLEISQKRLCSHAQSEIRELFRLIKVCVLEKLPFLADYLVPNCKNCVEKCNE